MECSTARERIGLYIDGELSTAEAADLQRHLDGCAVCAAQLGRTRALVDRLRGAAETLVGVPPDMWSRLAARLDARAASQPSAPAILPAGRRQRGIMRLLRKPLAAAASVVLFLGVATTVLVWTNRSAQTAAAATVDYSMLLDGLSGDVDAAVERFLAHYAARRVDASEAAQAAPRLDFAVPAELPGGFQREAVYSLRFGNMDGVAARYRREGEPLVAFFHPPVARTRMGVHKECECQVAGREGQRVEVGEWQLVHFTDPSTCHCLLSKIQDEALQARIFAAIAPQFP